MRLGQMTIGNRVGCAFGILLALVVTVAVTGYWGMETINAQVGKSLDCDGVIAQHAGRARANIIAMRRFEKDAILNVSDPKKAEEYFEKWREEEASVEKRLQTVEKVIVLPADRETLRLLNADLAIYRAGFPKVYQAIREGHVTTPAAGNAAMVPYKDTVHRMEKTAADFATDGYARLDRLKGTIGAVTNRVLLRLSLLVAAILAIGVTLAFFLSRKIAAILKTLVAEAERLAEAATGGELATRGDAEKIDFEFRGIVQGMNRTLDAVVGPLNVAAEYVDRISKGEIPPQITESYRGDFNEIKNNLNELVKALETVTGTAELIARGDLSVQITPRSAADQLMLALSKMVAQLRDLAAHAQRIAQGDLTVEITPASERDLMGNAFLSMVDNLREIVGSVSASAAAIASASEQIATGNTDLAQRTEEQASSLEETAASMEELTSTVQQNADNSQQANQLAITANEVAKRGGLVVGNVVGTMDAIGESSKKISDIIGVIDGIAFQTNILALNAAVEAARAGEQGRGFAVVAGEVRNLAQRSAAAAKEIKALIVDSVDKVESGRRLVGEAGDTMNEIVSSIKRVTDIMAEISAASSEQSGGIQQVNVAIATMDQITQQNSSLVQEAASAAGGLQEQAEVLVEAISRFTLEEERGRKPASRGQGGREALPAPLPRLSKAGAPARATGYGDQPEGRKLAVLRVAKGEGGEAEWAPF